MNSPEETRLLSASLRTGAWLRYPEAEQVLSNLLAGYLDAMPPARALDADLLIKTGSRLVDWLDHLVLADGDTARGQLADLGFEPEGVPTAAGDVALHHPGALFPRLILRGGTGAQGGAVVAAAIQVEEIADFLMTHRGRWDDREARGHGQEPIPIEGSPLSPYRRATVWKSNGHAFQVVERRGHAGFLPLDMPAGDVQRCLRTAEQWATRPRLFEDRQAGMEWTLALARALVAEVGTDLAAWFAFAAERSFWQRRNRAGQVQKARQDSLGLGWANHDHQAFRSSRDVFPVLIQILETFGFRPRERFFAGAEAGWGAQVLEQPVCRLAVFADVDLSPHEIEGDFAHDPLSPRRELGTIGLWCALHGESMLGAGMHHLAGRFEFDKVTADLAEWGIKMMPPFSEFPYLRQAFTRGERWAVADERLERLVTAGQIDEAQRAKFARDGAVGSHLENIQRSQGFKGFNQLNVSDIIRRTDPRAVVAAA